MRLAGVLAIALGLMFPVTGMARRQDPAAAAKSTEQAPAPSTAPAEKPPAEATPAPETTAPESVAKPQDKTSAVSAGTRTAKGSKKRRKRNVPPPDGGPRKIVVREGGAREPAAQIAPGMTPAEATRQRQSAEQLLRSTDDQLKLVAARTLDARQQETAAQIRNYGDAARSALKEGDVRRANTLAEKAHLLADDLMKH